MIAKTVVAVVLLGFLALTEAQGEPVSQGGVSETLSTRSAGATTSVVVGFNYFHIAYCVSIGTTLYIIPLESIGVQFFFTNNPAAQTTIAPACQTGNWVAVRVVDSNLNWDQIWTFTFK